MSEFFLPVLNMSISASWLILAVLLVRLLIKRAPKWISVLLWGMVGLRLLLPFSIESEASLIPSAQTITPQILTSEAPRLYTGFASFNNAVNPIVEDAFTPTVGASVNPLQIWISVASIVWSIGILTMFVYSEVSCLRVRRKIGTAVLLRKNIFQSENVDSAFVFGIIKPKIYLPFDMNEQEMTYVIAHEQAHIRRRDHWIKPLGFSIASFYWFNPLLWLGYVLLCRDIELACDEKVIKKLGTSERADYSQALLNFCVGRRALTSCPLAFGEVGVKERVKSVLRYRKPAFWLIGLAVIASAVLALCFLTDPTSGRLGRIESRSLDPLSEETSAIWTSDGQEYFSVTTIDRDLLRELFDLKISGEEISKSRDEYRDRSNTLVLQTGLDAQATANSYLTGLYIHFSSDFTSVWVNDGVKPTLSYQVSQPQKAREVYESIASAVAGEAVIQIPGLTNLGDIQSLKEEFPMYFDLGTFKGLEIYVWQMAENSYSCGVLPGRNRNYTPQEIWSLHQNAATLEQMQAIIASYMASGELTENDVTIIPVTMPHSSYAYVIDDAYCQALRELFWSGMKSESEVVETVEGNFRTYFRMSDGTWKFGDHTYRYRLEITGRMPNAVADTTYVYLSNLESISFQRAMWASGISSSMNDYFAQEEAVLVELWTNEEETPTGYPDGEIQQPQIRYNGKLYFYFATGFYEPLPGGYIYVGAVEAVDNVKTPQDDLSGARVDVGQKIYANEADAETIYVKYESGYAKFSTKNP